MMMERQWPGNVREPRQVVESSAVFGGNVIDRDSFALAVASRSEEDMDVSLTLISARGRLLAELDRLAWDTRAVAAHFGVHRATVYRWIRRYNIEWSPSLIGEIALGSSQMPEDLTAFHA
jgi:transcriptional regulator of acetoin/glycerol metabolism